MAEGYTEELFLLYSSRICRLCGEENPNGYPLFRTDNNEADLSLLINAYLPLKITDDGKYPRWICPGCHLQVDSTVQFFNLVVAGQESLRKIFISQCHEQQKADTDGINSGATDQPTDNEVIFEQNFNGMLFSSDHEIVQKMGGNPEKPKRKRGRPPKPAPEFQVAQKKLAEEVFAMNEVQLVDEPIVEESNGRRKRRIKVPSRFQEAVQGKELEKVYMESGVIERSDIGSDIEDSIEMIRGGFDAIYSEEVIGHLQDNEGVNLGDLVVINDKQKVYPKTKKRTRFMCDICKICFCYEQKFLQHRFSHQNVRFECTFCLQSFLERSVLTAHQAETGHKGEGIIEGFSLSPLHVNNSQTCNESAATVESSSIDVANSTQHSDLQNSSSKEDSLRNNDLDSSQIDQIDDYENQFEDVFKKIDEMAEAEHVLHQLQDNKSAQPDDTSFEMEPNFIDLKDFSVDDNIKKEGNYGELLDSEAEHLAENQRQTDDVADDDSVKRKNYYCSICDRHFKRVQSYIYHKESEHNDGRRFVCSKCKKSFKNKTLLQRHQLVHSTLRPFACTSCKATFKTKTNLFYHERSHTGERKYQCNICEQFFAHKNSLTLHLRCHTGQKPFKCSVCAKAFSQYGNMQEHMRIHTGECPFACQICGRKFKTSSQCRMHVKRHETDKPLKCTMCDKSFIQLQEFKNHQRRHNNIKPYSCKVCSKSFIELGALRKHIRLHTGERPYSCTECPRRFADRSNLKKHLKVHENKKRLNEWIANETKALDELVGPQSLIPSESNSNPVCDSTLWSLVDSDSCLDSNNTTALPQNNMGSNQLVYVTYQDPNNPIGNKTTLFVVNDTNSTRIIDNIKADSVAQNDLTTSMVLGESYSGDQELTNTNVFLTNDDNNSNDIQTVLLNIQNQVDMQLDQTELFQSDENNGVQLVTSDGQKMRLLSYTDSLDIPD